MSFYSSAWALLLTHNKPPVIEGWLPNERYNLDDSSHLQSLNLNPNAKLKLADQYDHYPDCKWAIIEYKSRSLRDGVEQLEETAKRLLNARRKVESAIIVSAKINQAEKHIFRKRGNLLYNKQTKTPVQIPVGVNRVEVQIYYHHEIDRQYKKYEGSLARWVSK